MAEGAMVLISVIRSQKGQSMAESIIILPVALLLIFGAMQFALLYHAKNTLNYAAYEAVRAGTLNHAQLDSIKEGFMRGMAPLYAYYDPKKNAQDLDDFQQGFMKYEKLSEYQVSWKNDSKRIRGQVFAFQEARRTVYDEMEDDRELVQITILRPDGKDFVDYAVDEEIPNDNLMYRGSQNGSKSGSSIQDANILQIRITYWYPLYVPFVKNMVHSVVCGQLWQDYLGGQEYKEYSADSHWSSYPACADTPENRKDPRFPLTVMTAMRMQSSAKKNKKKNDSRSL